MSKSTITCYCRVKYWDCYLTFLLPFTRRKHLLQFHCQQEWLMEVEWSAIHHSKWENVLGNGRNTHLHLSLLCQRAVIAPEWIATYRARQKNTKCLKVLTCANAVAEGAGGPVAKKTTTQQLSDTSLSGISHQIASYSFQNDWLTSFIQGGFWSINSFFGFHHFHLFSHLICSLHLQMFV